MVSPRVPATRRVLREDRRIGNAQQKPCAPSRVLAQEISAKAIIQVKGILCSFAARPPGTLPIATATSTGYRRILPIWRDTSIWGSMGCESDLPDLLPVRMLNEFVYCPRLFFYEWVEGVFIESVDT